MKIYPKILLSFLLLSLLPLLGLALYTYNKFANEIVSTEYAQLKATALEKMGALDHFFEELEDSALTVSKSLNSQRVVEGISDEGALFFNDVLNRYHLKNIIITDAQGSVLFSHNKSVTKNALFEDQVYQSFIVKELLQSVTQLARLSYSGFDFISSDEIPSIMLAVPILLKSQVEGVLFYEISPGDIYKIFSDYTLLRETGEMLVGKKIDNSALFINPIRHNPKAAFRLKIPIGSNIAFPMQQAVQGIGGQGKSIDYRAKEILAVWSYIPKIGWGVVVKIDFDEIFTPVIKFRDRLVLVVLLTFVIVSFLSIFLARSLAGPIKSLQETIVTAAKGEWSQRAKVSSRDEVGELAFSFNQLLDALQKSTTSIEELNNEIARREQLEKEKLQLLSRVSHELRTPITPIREGISLVMEEVAGKINEKQKELLDLAVKNVERLHYLVNEILDFQKIDLGKISYDFKLNNINQLIDETIESYRPVAYKKQIKLYSELDPAIPEIIFDRMRIMQVLSNLVSNAIKFTTESPISIFSRLIEDGIEVEVRQLGAGIHKDDLSLLFVPFQQITRNATYKQEGTGLGLIISKKIIENHKGRIWVESEPGVQTSFYFFLPKSALLGEV